MVVRKVQLENIRAQLIKNLNLYLADIVCSKLKGEGASVYRSRSSDTKVSLKTRYMDANSKKVNIFVSIHHNSSRFALTKGSMVLYAGKHDKKKSKLLAKKVNTHIKNAGLFYDRGIKKGVIWLF